MQPARNENVLPFGVKVEMSRSLEDRVDALVEAIAQNSAAIQLLVTQPPYVVVQPSTPRPMKHTPFRGPDGKIEYVIVEPYDNVDSYE